jgi:hypothetical protein
MTDETFFSALRDHLSAYTLRITYNSSCPLSPYAVELFTRGQSFRATGFLESECFQPILDTLGIESPPASKPHFHTQVGQAEFLRKKD